MSEEVETEPSDFAPSDQPGDSMHIHQPKAVHGWRELLSEIGVIVVGIAIALAGEQALEAFHWHHEVGTEREALRQEARENVGSAAYRETERPCIDRRLAGLQEIFRRQAKGLPLDLRAPITRPPLSIASTGSWEIALSGQALGHMPHGEKLAFSDAFDSYRAFNQLRNEEDATWRRLELINHADMLGAGDWVALHEAFGEAAALNSRMKSLTAYVLGPAALGEKPAKTRVSPADLVEAKAFCTPLV